MNNPKNELPEPDLDDEQGEKIADMLSELESEFWHIQGKVDKLGDFGFKVKAWSIALTSAFLVGGVSQKFDFWFLLLALFGILAFFVLDKHHDVWKSAFVKRCKVIEDRVERLRLDRSPEDAQVIRKWKKNRSPSSLIDAIKLKTDELRKPKWNPPWDRVINRKKVLEFKFLFVPWGRLFLFAESWIRNPWGLLILHANGLFYVFQTFLIIAATLWLAFSTHDSNQEVTAPISVGPVKVQLDDEFKVPNSIDVRIKEGLESVSEIGSTKDNKNNGVESAKKSDPTGGISEPRSQDGGTNELPGNETPSQTELGTENRPKPGNNDSTTKSIDPKEGDGNDKLER